MANKTTPHQGAALPGALGHAVAFLLVGAGVGFLLRFAYYAILTWTLTGALQVLVTAAVVTGSGWLGYQLTGKIAWWYTAGAIGVITVVGVAFLAFG